MFRRSVVGLALMGLALQLPTPLFQIAIAQPPLVVAENYDLDSTSYIYVKTGPLSSGAQRIQTAGSSTTVTAVSGTPFDPVVVGDQILVDRDDITIQLRTISAKASGASITVDSAIDLTGGFPFSYRKVTTGTGLDVGWYPCSKFVGGSCLWLVQIDQQNTTTGIDVRLECEVLAGVNFAPISVFERTGITVAGIGTAAAPGRFAIDTINPFDRCRLGMKLTSTDDGGDTGANAEQINLYVRTR